VGEGWLEVEDDQVDAQAIERRVAERLASRPAVEMGGSGGFLAQGLDGADPGQSSPETARQVVARWQDECDIVPDNYAIDWRVPILGRVHAAIRRVIHAEVRRFVLPALVKQSHLNRAVLRVLDDLCRENERLNHDLDQARQELARLRGDGEQEG
jgi:O-antigen chain-terminating methyltransferase